MPALRVVLVDPRVPVAVGDVEIAGPRAKGDVGGPVEGFPALERRRMALPGDRHQEFPLRGELSDRVVAIVRQPDLIFRSDRDGMGPPDQPLPQERKKFPCRSKTMTGCSPLVKT